MTYWYFECPICLNLEPAHGKCNKALFRPKSKNGVCVYYKGILKPNSPADPRPNNKPYYIAPNCPECGTPLELAEKDKLNEERWNDEFICPVCRDGIYMDWPSELIEDIKESLQEKD